MPRRALPQLPRRRQTDRQGPNRFLHSAGNRSPQRIKHSHLAFSAGQTIEGVYQCISSVSTRKRQEQLSGLTYFPSLLHYRATEYRALISQQKWYQCSSEFQLSQRADRFLLHAEMALKCWGDFVKGQVALLCSGTAELSPQACPRFSKTDHEWAGCCCCWFVFKQRFRQECCTDFYIRTQRQMNFYEFQASPIYTASSRPT